MSNTVYSDTINIDIKHVNKNINAEKMYVHLLIVMLEDTYYRKQNMYAGNFQKQRFIYEYVVCDMIYNQREGIKMQKCSRKKNTFWQDDNTIQADIQDYNPENF